MDIHSLNASYFAYSITLDSLVTSELAVKLHRQGYKVGVLDADITGPSIPKVFGIHEKAVGNDKGVFPAQTPEGIKIISVNLMLDNEEDPVIWRGPVIAGVVKQFWNEVIWGDLDYLLVDMPRPVSQAWHIL